MLMCVLKLCETQQCLAEKEHQLMLKQQKVEQLIQQVKVYKTVVKI